MEVSNCKDQVMPFNVLKIPILGLPVELGVQRAAESNGRACLQKLLDFFWRTHSGHPVLWRIEWGIIRGWTDDDGLDEHLPSTIVNFEVGCLMLLVHEEAQFQQCRVEIKLPNS